MTDYSKMSDVEISLAVGKLVSRDGTAIIGGNGKAVIHEYTAGGLCIGWKEFEPCNSWADSGPIIVANKIDLIQDNGQGCALATTSAIQMFQGDDVHIEQDENPLRAAMVVFLMMNEGE